MKRLLTIILLLSGLTSVGQGWEPFYKIKTRTEPFRAAIARDKVVYCIADSAWYSLDTTARATDSLATIIRWGKYTVIGGSTGGSGDSYWQEKAGTVSLKDTTNILNATSGDGGGRGYSIVSSSGSEFGIKAFYGSKSPSDSATIADAVRSSAVGSYDAGLFINTMGITLLREYTGGKSSGVGFIGEANGSPGYLHGFSDHNSGGRLNIGSSTDRWGKGYFTNVYAYISGNGEAVSGSTGETSNGYAIGGTSWIGRGVSGVARTSGTGVYGESGTGYAGYFISNSGNGIYSQATTAGKYAAALMGKVGIGKTNPSESLDVNGNIKGDTIKATGGTSTDWNTAAGWVTTNGGNVANWNTAYGWGNHADAGYLAVPDGGLAAGDMFYYSDFEKLEAIPKPTTDADHQLQWIGGDGGLPTWTTLDWIKSGSYLYRMNRVGIGIENPTRWLDVAGAIKGDSVFTGKIYGGTAAGDFVRVVSTTGSGTAGGTAFQVAGGVGGATNIITVKNDGKVGIGTTAPDATLTINGSLSASSVAVFSEIRSSSGNASYTAEDDCNIVCDQNNNDADTRSIIFGKNTTNPSGANELARITETGNLGIGTPTPVMKLDVNGGIRIEGTDTTGVGSTAKVGTIQYFNGHFYGLVGGNPPTWKQLNN